MDGVFSKMAERSIRDWQKKELEYPETPAFRKYVTDIGEIKGR